MRCMGLMKDFTIKDVNKKQAKKILDHIQDKFDCTNYGIDFDSAWDVYIVVSYEVIAIYYNDDKEIIIESRDLSLADILPDFII